MWLGRVGVDSLLLAPSRQTKVLVICPRPGFFSQTTTSKGCFSFTFLVLETSDQKRNWSVFKR